MKITKLLATFSACVFLISTPLTVSAIGKSSAPSKEVQHIIDQLNNSNNGIPDSVTKEDLQRVIDEGGKSGYNALLHIYNTATPASSSLTNRNNLSQQQTSNPISQNEEEYSISYNLETHKESRIVGSQLYDKGSVSNYSEENTDQNTDESNSLFSSALTSISLMSSISNYHTWDTSDPQKYSDTRAAAKLIIKCLDGRTAAGSGFLVSNDTVVTAGHCIYSAESGGWPKYIMVIPSYSASYPSGYYGSRTSATTVEVGGDWKSNSDDSDDWGIIKLTSSFSLTNYYTTMAVSNIKGWGIRSIGYPSQSNNLRNSTGTVKYMDSYSHNRLVKSNAWAEPGMSGGPILEDGKKVIGIVTKTMDSSGKGDCVFVKIDSYIKNRITYRINS